MTELPATIYLVVRDFGPSLGIGSGDVSGCYSAAFDQFADAVESGEAVAVWEIDVTGANPQHITDATDFFEADFLRLSKRRGNDQTPAVRFDPALPIAAE